MTEADRDAPQTDDGVELSVIVTVVDGGAALERCLDGLAAQVDAPSMEVIVPYDATLGDLEVVRGRHPGMVFAEMGPVATASDPHGPAGQHELFDRRRSAGLARARGRFVAIVEDRGVPRPGWARTGLAAHARLGHAVIGGAVENGRDAALNWAVFFCDFGRYQPPFEEGPREYVTDVNVFYARRAIEATRELWQERYHETTVHWALIRAGETLYLTPEFVVDQHRDGLRLGPMLSERCAWGRLFSYTRAREISPAKRLVLAALSPVLPFLLLARHGRARLERRRHFGKFVKASPAMFLLLAAWSLGEAVGSLTGRP